MAEITPRDIVIRCDLEPEDNMQLEILDGERFNLTVHMSAPGRIPEIVITWNDLVQLRDWCNERLAGD